MKTFSFIHSVLKDISTATKTALIKSQKAFELMPNQQATYPQQASLAPLHSMAISKQHP